MLFLLVMYPHPFLCNPSPLPISLPKSLPKMVPRTAQLLSPPTRQRAAADSVRAGIPPLVKASTASIIVRPRLAVEDYPKITLAAGLGVALAIDRLAGVFSQLKWPNDIFIDGKKCGGILTESSSLNEPVERRYAVIGIGLNLDLVSADFPVDIRDKTTSLFIETGKKLPCRASLYCYS